MKSGAAFVGFLFSGIVGIALGYTVGYTVAASKAAGSGGVQRGHDAPSDFEGQKPRAARGDRARRPAVRDGAKKPAPRRAAAEDVFKVPVGQSFAKGPDNALVTIIEFSDFQCPYCAKVTPTLRDVEREYRGDVRIVFKHQPLGFHKDARLASKYALAAGQQGKFWEMHDLLFENPRALKESDLKRYAAQLGLDQARIDDYLASNAGERLIQADEALARKIGARGTPTFFVNGRKLVGAQPLSGFKRVIDEELEKARALVQKGVRPADVYAESIKDGRDTPPAPAPRPKRQAGRQKVALLDRTPKKGGREPLVTIVAFSDFQCPYCGKVNPTLEQVQQTYGDKVQIRFRNLPLSFHQRAKPAAKAALAAHKQGKFWEMHDMIFADRSRLSDADFVAHARQLGLNVTQFEADMNSPEIAAWVDKDVADAGQYGASGTPSLFVNGILLRGAQPFSAFKRVIDDEIAKAEKLLQSGVRRAKVYEELLKREGTAAAADRPAARRPPRAPVVGDPVDIELGRAPLYGKPNAPVQLVVFSDFQCPYCSRVNTSIEAIKREYGNKVSVAFKHFPLSFHRQAELAAVASLAAHKQGKFWEMHDKLFANQRALGRQNLIQYAQDLGLNMVQFESDLDDPALLRWVKDDMAEGSKVGVRGTPATFINGRLVSGAQPLSTFKSVVEAELNK